MALFGHIKERALPHWSSHFSPTSLGSPATPSPLEKPRSPKFMSRLMEHNPLHRQSSSTSSPQDDENEHVKYRWVTTLFRNLLLYLFTIPFLLSYLFTTYFRPSTISFLTPPQSPFLPLQTPLTASFLNICQAPFYSSSPSLSFY